MPCRADDALSRLLSRKHQQFSRPEAVSFSTGTGFWIAFICATTKRCSTWVPPRRGTDGGLKTGRVKGVDIWSTRDPSGNARDVTMRNASLDGVGARVQVNDREEIDTGDMRALPYPDATFDLVVSSLAIHNVPSNADRKQLRATATYEEALRALGASNVERRRLQ